MSKPSKLRSQAEMKIYMKINGERIGDGYREYRSEDCVSCPGKVQYTYPMPKVSAPFLLELWEDDTFSDDCVFRAMVSSLKFSETSGLDDGKYEVFFK